MDSFKKNKWENKNERSRGPGVEVEKILEVTRDSLFKEPVIVERFLEEAIKPTLQIQQTLPNKNREI